MVDPEHTIITTNSEMIQKLKILELDVRKRFLSGLVQAIIVTKKRMVL
jgi:hypothetical protein